MTASRESNAYSRLAEFQFTSFRDEGYVSNGRRASTGTHAVLPISGCTSNVFPGHQQPV